MLEAHELSSTSIHEATESMAGSRGTISPSNAHHIYSGLHPSMASYTILSQHTFSRSCNLAKPSLSQRVPSDSGPHTSTYLAILSTTATRSLIVLSDMPTSWCVITASHLCTVAPNSARYRRVAYCCHKKLADDASSRFVAYSLYDGARVQQRFVREGPRERRCSIL